MFDVFSGPQQNYQNVAYLPYGQKFSNEDVPLIIHQTENGLGYCSSTDNLDIFQTIRDHATWTKGTGSSRFAFVYISL